MEFLRTSPSTAQALEGFVIHLHDNGKLFYLSHQGHCMLERTPSERADVIHLTGAVWNDDRPLSDEDVATAQTVITEAYKFLGVDKEPIFT